MEQTIESKAAAAILQEPMTIEIGGKSYNVAPPSIATLVLVSEAISELPEFKLTESRLMEDVLSAAKDCRSIGKIAATLILGAKGCRNKTRRIPRKKKHLLFWGFIRYTREEIYIEEYSPMEELADQLLEDLTPREMQNLIARILQQMQIGDFFGLTTFLLEVNLTRATKVDN